MGETNEITVFVDPDNGDGGGTAHGSGWWYEGGGLYRHVNLVRTSLIHVEQDGLFVYSNLTWGNSSRSEDSKPASSASSLAASPALAAPPSGTMHLKAALANGGKQTRSVCAHFTVTDPSGRVGVRVRKYMNDKMVYYE
jgi:hypothetical protein